MHTRHIIRNNFTLKKYLHHNHDLLAPQTGETSLEQYFEARKNF